MKLPVGKLWRARLLCIALVALPGLIGARHAASAEERRPRAASGRPPIEEILSPYYGFGVSAFSAGKKWPEDVKASHGVQWNFLYGYFCRGWKPPYLRWLLNRADRLGAIPVITYYHILQLGRAHGHSAAEEWEVDTRALQDPAVVKEYLDDVKAIMEGCAAFGKPVIFQCEPDAWNFWMLMHAGKTHDAREAAAAVDSSGHPDAAGLPDTVAGFAQALIRLRDRYAPRNVYMGLCAFDFRASRNPQHTVTWVNSMDAAWDILFECSVAKYSTGGDGWWDAFDEGAQKRYLNWLRTVTAGTGLKYLQWQLIIGPSDYGLLPNYPTEERVSGLIASGCVGAMFDLFKLEGPPHSQTQHGSTAVPPAEHPGYSSVGALANRLGAYYRSPLRWKKEIKKRQKKKERKPIILPDGTEIIIVGGIPVRRRRKDAPDGTGKSPPAPDNTAGDTPGAKKAKPARASAPERPTKPEPEKPKEPEEPQEPPEVTRLFTEAESIFIDGDSDKAAELFRKIVAEHPGTPSAAKAAEYLEIVE